MGIQRPKPVIEIYNLSKLFGVGDATTVALDNVNLRIEKGEFVCIMGPSGSGKTTLMNIAGLLDTPTHGEYFLEEKQVAELSQRRRAKLRRDHIGMIFQNFNLLGSLPVIENVALPLTYKMMLRTTRLRQASRVLKTFDLQEREYYMPHQLSGGQLQRVCIARALVNKPSIILADEPTGSLDTRSSEIIMQELSDIHRRGNTIIMVTHNPDIAIYAGRIIQMVDGRIASDTKEPLHDPKTGKKRALGTYRAAIQAAEIVSKRQQENTRQREGLAAVTTRTARTSREAPPSPSLKKRPVARQTQHKTTAKKGGR